jgi:hypothetical protein
MGLFYLEDTMKLIEALKATKDIERKLADYKQKIREVK